MESSSDSDDDEYYERMANQVTSEEENDLIIESGNPKICYDDDNQYFEALSQHGSAASQFAAEESKLWDKLSADIVTSSVISHANSFAQAQREHVAGILWWLKSRLPKSSKCFGFVQAYMKRNDVVGSFWCDNCENPSVLLIVSPCEDNPCMSLTLFADGPISNDESAQLISIISQLFTEFEFVHKIADVIFSGLDQDFLKISADMPAVSWTPDGSFLCGLYVYDSSINNIADKALQLSHRYEFVKLSIGDAETITAHWPYSVACTAEFVKMLVSQYPCVGIVQRGDRQLVSWCLTYDYGAIGMLHTLPEHRGCGLARAAVVRLLQDWLKFGWDCAPYCHVVDYNDASRQLFLSLGFRKASDQYWIIHKHITAS